ncbi:MAG TPA: hypothetical protein VMZ22_05370 [Acidimicrobiales bacterium]|nr:hypothetical protein [Acidimicrobiales bacterium]
MRVARKLLVGSVFGATALLGWSGPGSGGATPAALDCPVGALEPACGAANPVVGTVCGNPIPSLPTVGPVSVRIDNGGPIVACPV